MSGAPTVSFERLLNWLEGRLAAAEGQTVIQQITHAGDELQAQIQWLSAFASLSDQILLLPPPPSVRATLLQRFVDAIQPRPQPGFFQRLVATLAFDSIQQPALAGLRAGGSEAQRQLVFVTDQADVALSVASHQHGATFDLIGQILPNRADLTANAFAVQLVQAQREVAITLTDEVGDFTFPALERGNYGLFLSADQVEIEIPDLGLTDWAR